MKTKEKRLEAIDPSDKETIFGIVLCFDLDVDPDNQQFEYKGETITVVEFYQQYPDGRLVVMNIRITAFYTKRTN